MKSGIIIAGFGGQGVLTLGVILANSAVLENRHATWLPSYGPEMRGGTANCHVIISDSEIGSPVVNKADILIAFNQPSLEKFFSRLKETGILILNSSLIDKKIRFRKQLKIPLITLGEQAGSQKVINIIALGSLLWLTGIVDRDSAVKSIEQNFREKKNLIGINKKALEVGMEYASHKNPDS